MKALIAEDDVPTRMLLTATLRGWGYDVHGVDDGEDAFAIMRAGEHQILITDWEMPRLDGPALCERIRNKLLSDRVYILLLTQHNDPARIERGLAAGADDFVSKPFNPLELHIRLEVGKKMVLLWDQLASARRQLAIVNEELDALRVDSTGNPSSSSRIATNERTLISDVHRRALRRRRSYGILGLQFSTMMAATDREHWMTVLRRATRDSDVPISLDENRAMVIVEGLSVEGLRAMASRFEVRFASVLARGADGATLGSAFFDGIGTETTDELLARAFPRV